MWGLQVQKQKSTSMPPFKKVSSHELTLTARYSSLGTGFSFLRRRFAALSVCQFMPLVLRQQAFRLRAVTGFRKLRVSWVTGSRIRWRRSGYVDGWNRNAWVRIGVTYGDVFIIFSHPLAVTTMVSLSAPLTLGVNIKPKRRLISCCRMGILLVSADSGAVRTELVSLSDYPFQDLIRSYVDLMCDNSEGLVDLGFIECNSGLTHCETLWCSLDKVFFDDCSTAAG